MGFHQQGLEFLRKLVPKQTGCAMLAHDRVSKTEKQTNLVQRKWRRFVDTHGNAYNFDKEVGQLNEKSRRQQ